jgi:hypothetical protein
MAVQVSAVVESDPRLHVVHLTVAGAPVHRTPTGQLMEPRSAALLYFEGPSVEVGLVGPPVDPRTLQVLPGEWLACQLPAEHGADWVDEHVDEHRPPWSSRG